METHAESPKPVARWVRALAWLFTLILTGEIVYLPYFALRYPLPWPTWQILAFGVLVH